MNKNIFTAYRQEGQLLFPNTFVTELDDNSVKELHLDKDMAFYNKCLTDDDFLNQYIWQCYCDRLIKIPPEERAYEDLEYIKNNWKSICEQEKTTMLEHIHEQIQYINDCCIPIYERRTRVSSFFNQKKDILLNEGHLLSNGRIINIGFDIPDDIFFDIYYILADALCCRFQLNQFDGKYREGMYLCLQYLDYRYHFNKYDEQYPDATDDEIEILNRTNLLDIVTGRGNSSLEVDGKKYNCSAYLDDELFRLKIEELLPWNISNAQKDDLKFDFKNHSLWTVDERFKVILDATLMSYYIFIFENPDMDIDKMFNNKDIFIKCLDRCDSGSSKFEECYTKSKDNNPAIGNKAKKNFEKELNKRISAIKNKVCNLLGEAYSIVKNENGSYYIPISKNITERPNEF